MLVVACRTGAAVFDGHLRKITDKGVEPIGRGLAHFGVTPDHLTILGLIMGVATGATIGAGHPLLGFFFLIASALPDLFDGAVARATNTSSMRGAFFDSTVDRVTDALLLGGIAWYLGNTRGFRSAMLAFAVLGVSALISYMRAKAEIYGLDAKGGLMERAERIIVICVGLVFSSLMVPVLWLMLTLTSITAVQRFVKIWKQADRPPLPPARAERAERPTSLRRTEAGRRLAASDRRRPVRIAGKAAPTTQAAVWIERLRAERSQAATARSQRVARRRTDRRSTLKSRQDR
jgi:CDP-diacylglycerol---glycerol-3-phosphate 3-phosphatidyltransferase